MVSASTKKRRIVKKPETVREASKNAQNNVKPVKKSKLRFLFWPFVQVWKILTKVLKPFAFVLAPFKTKPARFIGRILYKIFFLSYFIGSWQELKKVEWPDARSTAKLTIAVFIFAGLFSVMIAVVDLGLDKVFQKLLLN